ncbi:MAG: OmpA family protein [Cyclobacteriaceae bacterium]|nr:PD40 domain-containing protein [Cyclobacteriaceae bacterium]MCH8516863.1 OmpA family protein [Cyclobacteriaceae bacterium]
MKADKGLFFIFYVVLSLGYLTDALSQNSDRFQPLSDATGYQRPEQGFQWSFPNINKIGYFKDEKKIELLRKLEREKKYEKLFKELKNYVYQFGVQNFYRDTYYIWRLAKLAELYGDPEEAVFLYKIALRHHRENIDLRMIEVYFDEAQVEKKEDYVPIEYYYELVEYRKQIDTLRPPRGVLLNMGKNINSESSDYGPTLSLDNQTLIFTSKRNVERNLMGDSRENEDLYYSKKIMGQWQEAKRLNGLSGRFNEGSACLSRSGKKLYFARCGDPDGYGSCDLYEASLQADSTWGEVRNLGSNINSVGWDSHPSLSPSGDTLYFASDRIGGFGMSDIYFSVKDAAGNWQRAQNAGPVINTRNNEVSPFYHPKYDVLYFSSNGQLLNFGSFDIYKSYKYDDAWGEPKNIGPLVNGEESEFYFTIDSDSKQLYYAKSKKKDKNTLDLFSFPLPMEAQPEATTKFKGRLRDEISGRPLEGMVSIIDLDNGIEVSPKFLKDDGTFEFELINNNNYLVVITGSDFFRIEEIFYLEGDTSFDALTEAISSRINFKSIEFEQGAAELKPEMMGDLNKISNFLLDNPDFKVEVAGHTDAVGNEQVNIKLSQDRAEAIQDYLINFGSIDKFRVQAKGYGSSEPIMTEDNEEARKMNRRVEFRLYRPSKEELEQDERIREEEDDNWIEDGN